jgi:hypothetical protein
MSVDDDSDDLMHLQVGELVILRDGQRGTIEEITLDSAKLSYTVRLADGSQRVVDVDALLRAKTYAAWVAPGTEWTGEERRKDERRVVERRAGERRSSERAGPDRRADERRKGGRRQP